MLLAGTNEVQPTVVPPLNPQKPGGIAVSHQPALLVE